MPFHYPLLASQSAAYIKSGATLLLKYGNAISKLRTDACDILDMGCVDDEKPKPSENLKAIKLIQKQVESFFNTGDGKDSALKRYLLPRPDSTVIYLPKTTIIALLLHHLMTTDDVTPITTLSSQCSHADPDGRSSIEYRVHFSRGRCTEADR